MSELLPPVHDAASHMPNCLEAWQLAARYVTVLRQTAFGCLCRLDPESQAFTEVAALAQTLEDVCLWFQARQKDLEQQQSTESTTDDAQSSARTHLSPLH